MGLPIVDRDTFLRHLRKSQLLSKRKFDLVVEKLGHLQSAREIAKALASWKLLTRFQAKMLLLGRKSGFHVGPYRILDELGHGGMGYVYKAVHLTMKRTVALKILMPQTIADDKARAMFKREVRAAAQLHHPNIALAYDASLAAGRNYLAMEYIAGPNLEQYVTKHGPLPIGLACEIIFQAANGLQHAHEKGVVHRDIKPGNLLVHNDPAGPTLQVKILDFGLARLRQANDDGVRGPVSGEPNTIMGTPDFLSPEQTKDLHDADIRSDLYSLGCTFYYLLAGQVPFPGGGVVHKLNRHDREIAKPIEELRLDLPKAIAKIVRKMMAKHPDDRFQTPDELMDALAPHAEPGALKSAGNGGSSAEVNTDHNLGGKTRTHEEENETPTRLQPVLRQPLDSLVAWLNFDGDRGGAIPAMKASVAAL